MKLILLLVLCFAGLWASGEAGRSNDLYDPGKEEPTQQELVEHGILPGYEGGSANVDYDSYQFQPAKEGEQEGDSVRDEAFDCELTDETGRPEEPEEGVIPKLCDSEKQGISEDAKRAGINVYAENATCTRQPNPYTYYVDRKIWHPYLKCCPKVWNYGCRSVNSRLPCFLNYYKNRREWCCPAWKMIYTARCLCNKCNLQTSQCVHPGKCQYRYSRRVFVAYCYRFGWVAARIFRKLIPSSCFCRIG